MYVTSPTLDDWLKQKQIGGTSSRYWTIVEFNNTRENDAHTVYDPSSVDTAIVTAWASDSPPPQC